MIGANAAIYLIEGHVRVLDTRLSFKLFVMFLAP